VTTHCCVYASMEVAPDRGYGQFDGVGVERRDRRSKYRGRKQRRSLRAAERKMCNVLRAGQVLNGQRLTRCLREHGYATSPGLDRYLVTIASTASY
jgi:hypothetical protein